MVTLAKNKKLISLKKEKNYLDLTKSLVGGIQSALNLEPQIKQWAKHFSNKEGSMFLGRGFSYPIALEGALKLKRDIICSCRSLPCWRTKTWTASFS